MLHVNPELPSTWSTRVRECVLWVRSGQVPACIIATGTVGACENCFWCSVLLGNWNKPGRNWNTYIAREGQQLYHPNLTFLMVYTNCSMAWVPHCWRCITSECYRHVRKRTASLQLILMTLTRQYMGGWDVCWRWTLQLIIRILRVMRLQALIFLCMCKWLAVHLFRWLNRFTFLSNIHYIWKVSHLEVKRKLYLWGITMSITTSSLVTGVLSDSIIHMQQTASNFV